MRTAAKRDANEAEIIAALVEAGYAVDQLSDKAIPDLIVAAAGVNVLIEVKTATGRLTKAQQKWWAKPWPGPRFIARTAQEALEGMEKHTKGKRDEISN